MNKEDEILKQEKASMKGKIHFVLSNSYMVFLFAVVLGVIFDIIIPLDFFSNKFSQYFGLIMIFFGSGLIYWAQSSSSSFKKKKENSNLGFDHGPYKYLRSPTHFGLFIMTLGLALIINSPFSVLFTIIAHIITKRIFIKKEEKLLEEKYGEDYISYKKKVRNHI